MLLVDIDIDTNRRRAELTEASPSVRAHGLVVREALIDDLALAVADRMAVDSACDSRPYLLAASRILAADWCRGHMFQTGNEPITAEEAVDRIIDLVQGSVAVLAEQIRETRYCRRPA